MTFLRPDSTEFGCSNATLLKTAFETRRQKDILSQRNDARLRAIIKPTVLSYTAIDVITVL